MLQCVLQCVLQLSAAVCAAVCVADVCCSVCCSVCYRFVMQCVSNASAVVVVYSQVGSELTLLQCVS